MHLSLQALLHETEKIRIAVWDSTELKPDMNIPAIHSELKAAYRRPTLDMFKEGTVTPKEAYIKKGAITLEGVGGEEIPLTKADLVIMNPPFTRQERLPGEYKDALLKRFKEYENQLHGQLGLWGYFVLLADRFVKEGGRVALVLPATVLRIASTQGIRDLLTENYGLKYIITTYHRAAFSEGAQFREILLVAEKTKNSEEEAGAPYYSKCLVVFLKKIPRDITDSRRVSLLLKTKRRELGIGNTYEDELVRCKIVSQTSLQESASNLFKLIATSDWRMDEIWERIKERGLSNFKTF